MSFRLRSPDLPRLAMALDSPWPQVNAIKTILVEEEFGDYNEKTFEDIRNFEEIWEWVEGVMIPGMYPDEKYNGEPFEPTEIGAVMTYNRIVGAVRFRQVRSIPNRGCPEVRMNGRLMRTPNGTVFTDKFVEDCHYRFSLNNEEKAPFGPGVGLIDEHGSCDAIPAPPPPPSAWLDKYGRSPTGDQLNAMAVRKLCTAFTWSSAEENEAHASSLDVQHSTASPFPLPLVSFPCALVRLVAQLSPTSFPSCYPNPIPLTLSHHVPIPTLQEKGLTGYLNSYPGSGYVRDVENPIDCREKPDEPVRGLCERTDVSRQDLTVGVEQLKSNLWLDEATVRSCRSSLACQMMQTLSRVC